MRYIMGMDTVKHMIGELLDRGFTRTQIAQEAGVSISTVCRVYSKKYDDMDYAPGKRIELMFKRHKRKKKIRRVSDE